MPTAQGEVNASAQGEVTSDTELGTDPRSLPGQRPSMHDLNIGFRAHMWGSILQMVGKYENNNDSYNFDAFCFVSIYLKGWTQCLFHLFLIAICEENILFVYRRENRAQRPSANKQKNPNINPHVLPPKPDSQHQSPWPLMNNSSFYHNIQEVPDKYLMNEWINGIKSTVLKATCNMLPIWTVLNSNGTFSWNCHHKYCHHVEILERVLMFRIWEQRGKVTFQKGLTEDWSTGCPVLLEQRVSGGVSKNNEGKIDYSQIVNGLGYLLLWKQWETLNGSCLLNEGVTH